MDPVHMAPVQPLERVGVPARGERGIHGVGIGGNGVGSPQGVGPV
jgi:hypothetical protein